MQRRYLPIAILTAILGLAALTGYILPAKSETPPVRLLFENKGGKVIFTHADHAAYEGDQCGTCHHTSGEEQSPPKCSSCHVKKFDDTFKESHPDIIDTRYCASCHHPKASISNFDHDLHAMDLTGEDCQACHHTEDIEPEPQACSNCHEFETKDKVVSLKQANHTRCGDCHEDYYMEGIKGCSNCHTREMPQPDPPETIACSKCHAQPVENLVPTRTKAFHNQCRGCHEKQNSGPYTDDVCFKCHMQ